MKCMYSKVKDSMNVVHQVIRPLVDRPELYADIGCPDLWLLEELSAECWIPSGVEATCAPATRFARALNRVGALICDFLGVTVADLCRLEMLEAEERSPCDGVEGIWATFERRPAVRNGCRRAEFGLIRRSGSQLRHFAMKSTNSSSSQRKTCDNDLEPGLRLRPFELTTGRGAPVASKHSRLKNRD